MSGNLMFAVWMAMGFVAIFAIWELALQKSLWVALGLAYATVPFFAMSELRGNTEFGLFLILVLFACVWEADIFAFFFGKAIGSKGGGYGSLINIFWSHCAICHLLSQLPCSL